MELLFSITEEMFSLSYARVRAHTRRETSARK